MKVCNTERAFDFVGGTTVDAGCYFSEVALDIHAQLLSEGAVVIRGAKRCRDPGEFEKAIGALGFQTRDYVGGSSPRSTIHGRVMEATRTPPDWSIILHQEMAYVKDPPEIIAFVCVEPATEGGESVVGDMRKLELLVDRSTLNQLTERGLKLRRTLPAETRVHLKPGLKSCAACGVGISNGVATICFYGRTVFPRCGAIRARRQTSGAIKRTSGARPP